MSFDNLSFWEKKWLTDQIDFLVVGAGIVGLSTAFHLKKKYPKSKIVVIDKGVLPFSASSKNAGFACFGSPSELLDDFSTMAENDVWKTVEMRWQGLNALKTWLGEKEIDLQTKGSWDLIETKHSVEEIRSQLEKLNRGLKIITGKSNVYSQDKNAVSKFGFENLKSCFYNRLEGQLDTAKLMQIALKKVQELDIHILRGVELSSYSVGQNDVSILTNFGELKTQNLILCTNGFTAEFDPKTKVKPARAQVLITEEIPDLKINGTFHLDCGYYYFRNIGNRLLIGGGRNVNLQKEETTEIMVTDEIQAAIEDKLRTIILPKTVFKIEQRWAGVMGVGEKKEPIIERLNSRVCVGIRMGGMGVAIGTLVGQKLADLHS